MPIWDWSPDGTTILFVSARGDTTSVWTMNTDGGDEVDVTQASIYDADPGAVTRRLAHRLHARRGRADVQPLDGPRRRDRRAPSCTNAPGTQRNSFPDWESRVAETIATLEPVADTFVRASDPDTPHGAETTFDVHAGASLYCDQVPGPAYGLLRFNLSSLPAGVHVTDARLDLTVVGGFAQDGDGSHYAIRLDSNTWARTSRGPDRPEDGIEPGRSGRLSANRRSTAFRSPPPRTCSGPRTPSTTTAMRTAVVRRSARSPLPRIARRTSRTPSAK